MRRILLAAPLVLTACVGTTGGDVFSFDAAAAGPKDAGGGALQFETSRDFLVTLTRAKVHVGAVYLNHALPVSGAQATSCTLPGVYVAEVTRGMDVDALSGAPVAFPEQGEALGEQALAAEVWLTGGAVDATDDATVILDVAGTAETKAGVKYPFAGSFTIGENRVAPAMDPALPGASPICKQRIVSPIAVKVKPTAGGRLVLRVDPRVFFTNVDFTELDKAGDTYQFRDETVGQPSVNLYQSLRSQRAYTVEWIAGP